MIRVLQTVKQPFRFNSAFGGVPKNEYDRFRQALSRLDPNSKLHLFSEISVDAAWNTYRPTAPKRAPKATDHAFDHMSLPEAIETAIRSHAERLADGTAGFQVWGGTKLVAEASIDL